MKEIFLSESFLRLRKGDEGDEGDEANEEAEAIESSEAEDQERLGEQRIALADESEGNEENGEDDEFEEGEKRVVHTVVEINKQLNFNLSLRTKEGKIVASTLQLDVLPFLVEIKVTGPSNVQVKLFFPQPVCLLFSSSLFFFLRQGHHRKGKRAR